MESSNFEEILETHQKMFECIEEVEKLGRDTPELRLMKQELLSLQEKIDEMRVQQRNLDPANNSIQ